MLKVVTPGPAGVMFESSRGQTTRLGGSPLQIVSKMMDLAPIAFRGTSCRGGSEVQAGLALLGEFEARFAARLGFAVQLLGDRGRSTEIAQTENVDFEVASFGFDGEPIADANLA